MKGCLRLSAEKRAILLRTSAALQVVAARGIVPVPGARASAAGLLPLGGRAVPVFRLEALRLPFETAEPAASGRGAVPSIVIVDVEGARIGLLVERVESVRMDDRATARALEGRDILKASAGEPGGRGRAATAAGEP